jgi:hypothetical protein
VVAKTAASVSFIATVAVIGLYVGTRETVIDGRVLEADLLPRLQAAPRHARLASLRCDDRVPVTSSGATFQCLLVREDGVTILARFTMGRDGALEERIVLR